MIRLAILADSPALHDGLANAFAGQSDIEVVGSNGADVVIDARLEQAVNIGDDQLVAVVRAVAAGLVVVPASLMPELLGDAALTSMDSHPESADAAHRSPLTSREEQVLGLLAHGHANKAIAARLGITDHTVKTHIAAVYEKLGARNRAEAVVAAARLGLVAL